MAELEKGTPQHWPPTIALPSGGQTIVYHHAPTQENYGTYIAHVHAGTNLNVHVHGDKFIRYITAGNNKVAEALTILLNPNQEPKTLSRFPRKRALTQIGSEDEPLSKRQRVDGELMSPNSNPPNSNPPNPNLLNPNSIATPQPAPPQQQQQQQVNQLQLIQQLQQQQQLMQQTLQAKNEKINELKNRLEQLEQRMDEHDKKQEPQNPNPQNPNPNSFANSQVPVAPQYHHPNFSTYGTYVAANYGSGGGGNIYSGQVPPQQQQQQINHQQFQQQQQQQQIQQLQQRQQRTEQAVQAHSELFLKNSMMLQQLMLNNMNSQPGQLRCQQDIEEKQKELTRAIQGVVDVVESNVENVETVASVQRLMLDSAPQPASAVLDSNGSKAPQNQTNHTSDDLDHMHVATKSKKAPEHQ